MESWENVRNVRILSVLGVPSPECRHSCYDGKGALRYEMVYRMEGENVTTINGTTVKNQPGSVMLIPRMEGEYTYGVDILKPGYCVDVWLEAEGWWPEKVTVVNSEDSELRGIFARMETVWSVAEPGYRHRTLALLYQALAVLESSQRRYLPKNLQEKLEPGLAYIRDNCFSPELDLEKPHQLCGMSRTYFGRLYHSLYGTSAMQHVTGLRMERAGELLKSGMFSVSEAAAAVGYRDLYHFSHLFREKMGCAPSRYGQSTPQKDDKA